MRRLIALAEARAQAAAERIADEAELPPGVSAEVVEGGVRLSGRGLVRRWIGDARLRSIGINARRMR